MEWKETKTDIQMPSHGDLDCSHDDLDWILTRLGKAEAENVQYYAAYHEAEASCRRWKFATVLVALVFLIMEAVVWWWV